MAATWRHLCAHSVLTAISVAQSPSNSPVTNDSGCPLHNRARASMTQRLTTEPSSSLTPTPHTHTRTQITLKTALTWPLSGPSWPLLLLCFFPLHLTRDNPQYRSVLVRRADVTRCPPVKLIWIYTLEETAREGRIYLHYEWKKERGIQPRGSFLYARLIKCLTASVDGITDCWTKRGGAGLSVWLCAQFILGFQGLTALGLWQACCTTPAHRKCNALTSFRSPSLRTAQSSAVRRGQTWRKAGGWKAEAKMGRKRMRGETVRG